VTPNQKSVAIYTTMTSQDKGKTVATLQGRSTFTPQMMILILKELNGTKTLRYCYRKEI